MEYENELADEMRNEESRKKRKYANTNPETISREVGQALNALKATSRRPKCDLHDTEETKRRTEEYLEACSLSGTFPSLMGLAAYGYGMPRENMNQFVRDNPQHPTAEYIKTIKSVFADILTNASLNNSANVIQTIFQLKNHFGHEDHKTVEVAPTQSSLLLGARSREEIEERYRKSIGYDSEQDS